MNKIDITITDEDDADSYGFIVTDDSGLGISPGAGNSVATGGHTTQSSSSVGGIGGHSHSVPTGPWHGNITISNGAGINFGNLASSASTTKEDVVYVIVAQDNSCLELFESEPITIKEILGLHKFFTAVQVSITSDINIDWHSLILALEIQAHFTIGESDHNNYDDDSSILYVKLFSA